MIYYANLFEFEEDLGKFNLKQIIVSPMHILPHLQTIIDYIISIQDFKISNFGVAIHDTSLISL